MKYCYKEIIIPIAGLIAIVLLVYMEKIWLVVSGFDATTITTTITATMSSIIACCVLVVTARQTRQNLEYNQLSVRPLLGSDLSEHRGRANESIKFVIVNHGTGPAIIEKMILFVDKKKKLQNSSNKYFNFIQKELHNNKKYVNIIEGKVKSFTGGSYGFLVPKSIMGVGERQVIWDVKDSSKTKDAISFIKRLDLRVEYTSFYKDEVFVYDTRYDLKFHDDTELK